MAEKLVRKLPGNGEFFATSKVAEHPTVIFVHFFGGTKRHMLKHVKFVNELGYDAVTFDLSYNKRLFVTRPPISIDFKFGLKHVWADEIQNVVNSVRGPKILYAFSNPASCTIEAIARNSNDIVGMVCDSGPFINLKRCNWNLLSKEMNLKSPLLNIPIGLFLLFVWGLDHEKTLLSDIASLPQGFPLLSIRGWNDPLVPVSAIDGCFENAEHLDYQTLGLPEAKHLNGLKDFGSDYKPKVAEFLIYISSKSS